MINNKWMENPVLSDISTEKMEVLTKILNGAGDMDAKQMLTYFIKEMYDSDMNTLTAYTITYDIKSDGETVVSEKTPIVEEAEKYINTYQGNFINYIDGKGNDNTDEKTDHKAVIGEKTTMMPQNNQGNTQYVDVQKSGSGASVTTIVIVCGLLLIGGAIGGVMYFRHKENTKNGLNTDSDNIDNDMT